MHAAIRRYNTFPNAGETIINRVNEEFLPQVRQMPGFVAYYLVDAHDGTMVSVSVFEDRAAAEESSRQASTFVRERLGHFVRNAPVISTGDVVVHLEAGAVP